MRVGLYSCDGLKTRGLKPKVEATYSGKRGKNYGLRCIATHNCILVTRGLIGKKRIYIALA